MGYSRLMIDPIPFEKLKEMLVEALAKEGLKPNSKVKYLTGSGGPKVHTTVRTSRGLVHVDLWDGTGWGPDFTDVPNEFHIWGKDVPFARNRSLHRLLEGVNVKAK